MLKEIEFVIYFFLAFFCYLFVIQLIPDYYLYGKLISNKRIDKFMIYVLMKFHVDNDIITSIMFLTVLVISKDEFSLLWQWK